MARNKNRTRPPSKPQRDANGKHSATQDELLGLGAALDSTLPPTPMKRLLESGGAGIYVISRDDELVDTVQIAGGEHYPIHPVRDWSELVGFVKAGRCKILLLDAETTPGHVEKRIAELRAHDASLIIVVAASRETTQKLIGLLSERRIHRLLIKPAALGITRLLLESAVSRYLQLREEAAGRELEMAFEAPPGWSPKKSGTKWPAWLLAVAIVSLLIGGAMVAGLSRLTHIPHIPFIGDGPTATAVAPAGEQALPALDVEEAPVKTVDSEAATEPPPAAAAADAAAEQAPAADPFAEQLERANRALKAGRVAEPAEDNAIDQYAAILARDSDHAEARRQLNAALEILYGRAQDALLAGELDDAAATLRRIGGVSPDSKRLAFLQTQLERARAQAAADEAKKASAAQTKERGGEPADNAPTPADADASLAQASPAEASSAGPTPSPAVPAVAAPAAPPSELDRLLATARERLEQNQLLEPADDSASDYLDRASARAANDPRVLQLRTDLAASVAARARVVLERGDVDGADVLSREAFALGADKETLAVLDIDIATARDARVKQQRATLLASGIERMRQGRWTSPQGDSALYYLATLQSQDPGFPGLDSALSQLTDALSSNARTAIGDSHWAAAHNWIDALARVSTDSAALQKLRDEATFGQRQAEFLTTPVPIGEMSVVATGSPVYPQDAQRRNIEGWVDVQFTVGRDGVPREAHVVDADPTGWFEDAALVAIAQYRFTPFEADGHVYERLVRARVRFGLQ